MYFSAKEAAKEVGLTLPELFSFQFVLTPDTDLLVDGFEHRSFGGRHLFHCPKLDAAVLCDREGLEIGYALGIAIDGKGVRVSDRYTINVKISDGEFWSDIEGFAIGLAGRWLLLIHDKKNSRIFGDASGQYNCVFDPKTGVVGSTLLMCLTRPIEESDEVDYRETLTKGMRLPFNRTRDRYARRLSVNHFLQLSDLSETRFWPRRGELAEAEPGSESAIITEIHERLSAVFVGIVTSTPTAVGVSGGNDSRNLLAVGRVGLGRVKRFFSHTSTRNSRVDYRVACKVMETLGYEVENHPASVTQYTQQEIEARTAIFQRSTGYCVGLHQMTNIKLDRRPPAGDVILLGNVMEALRAEHWKSSVRKRDNWRKFGLKRCLFVGSEHFDGNFVDKWRPEFIRWYKALPADSRDAYIDLAFVEHNLPNLGVTFFANLHNFTVCPFNDRRLIALSARLPLPYRYSNQANRDLLRLAAPELSEIPFAKEVMQRKARLG